MPKVLSMPFGGPVFETGLTRRAALIAAGATVVSAAIPGLANTSPVGLPTPKSDSLRYDIRYLGFSIGQQYLTFQKRQDSLRVDSRTIMEVRLGPLSAYKYAQESRELWEGGRLTRLHAVTEEDGEESVLSGVAIEDGFAVTLREGTEIYPADLFTNNDVWTLEALRAPYLIDVRDGELLPQRVEGLGTSLIEVDGRSTKARHFAVQGKKLAAQLWYDSSLLVKADVSRGDHTVEYHLSHGTPPHLVAARERGSYSDYDRRR